MKRRLMIFTLLSAAALPADAAPRTPPPPVCANPDILGRVTQRLHARYVYAEIDRESISEEPTGKGDVVRCGVCVKIFLYDTARFGAAPVYRCEPHAYIVEALPAGFVLISVE